MAKQEFEIQIKGHLNPDWADWLEGMRMDCLENGEMILCGALADQAALLGVLNKLNRLNLTILSVNETGRKDPRRMADDRPVIEKKFV
jgi:haloalkane dehalogenase